MQKIALISVYNKKGIVEFGKELTALGWKILSSGGTHKVLQEAGVPSQDVAEITGQGAVLGHRVVTLQPHIHGGLMATEAMTDELEQLGYPRIDLLCVDLYPLEKEIKREGSTPESILEKTDIGGPTLIRSAAKGRRIVICDHNDRIPILTWLKEGMPEERTMRILLAAKAEAVVSDYCRMSVGHLLHDALYGFTEDSVRLPRWLYGSIERILSKPLAGTD